MKLFFASNKRKLVCLAALVCMIAVGSISALAATSHSPVSRDVGDNHTGRCCTDWDSSVQVYEPFVLAPIVVTWSTDYQSTAPFSVGLSLNNGPCVFNGPSNIPTFVSPDGLTYGSHTVQWLFLPGDYKLVRGWNTIRLCGGGVFSDTDTLLLGSNTLAARVGN